MSNYEATVTREGKWWMVQVSGVDGVTQARRLGEVELMAREFVAVSLKEPLEDIEVTVVLDTVGSLVHIQDRIVAIERDRSMSEALARKASQEAASLAKKLAEQDVPVRDIGAVLGVSFQRAHQLVNARAWIDA